MTDTPTTTSVFQYIDTGQPLDPSEATNLSWGDGLLTTDAFLDAMREAYAAQDQGPTMLLIHPETANRIRLWYEWYTILRRLFGRTDPTREQLRKVRFPAKFREIRP